MTEPLYRFTRVLEYIGTRTEIDRAIEMRQVKGTSPKPWAQGKLQIYEAVLGDCPQRADENLITHIRQMLSERIDKYKTLFEDNPQKRAGYLLALYDILDELPL